MKKKVSILSITLIAIISFISILNSEVTTKQGKDYEVTTISLPLYLKVLNFFDRHLNYIWLVKTIVGHLETEEDKIFHLFRWTYETILPQPNQLPIMDDHVWNVYIRGYGTSDNTNDLFSTLCNYIGTDAFFTRVFNIERNDFINFSFVKTSRGWVVLDPDKGVYFNNDLGKLATVSDIQKNNWKIMYLKDNSIPDSYYQPYLKSLRPIKDIGLRRANSQSPVNRFLLQLTQWWEWDKPLLE